MVVMLAGLSVIVFITIELPPGDFADRRALDLRSQGISVTQEDVTAMRHQMGLDRPWFQRYVTWITNIVFHGNFGQSFGQHRPVSEVLGERVDGEAIAPGCESEHLCRRVGRGRGQDCTIALRRLQRHRRRQRMLERELSARKL